MLLITYHLTSPNSPYELPKLATLPKWAVSCKLVNMNFENSFEFSNLNGFFFSVNFVHSRGMFSFTPFIIISFKKF